jgi:hypothetical protein
MALKPMNYLESGFDKFRIALSTYRRIRNWFQLFSSSFQKKANSEDNQNGHIFESLHICMENIRNLHHSRSFHFNSIYTLKAPQRSHH